MTSRVKQMKTGIATERKKRKGCQVSVDRIGMMVNETAPRLLQKIANDGCAPFTKGDSGLHEMVVVKKWIDNPRDGRVAKGVLSYVLKLDAESSKNVFDEMVATGFAIFPTASLPEAESQAWGRIVSLVTDMPADVALLIKVLEERLIENFDPFITATMLKEKGWSAS
jgi:hypothetical protein